MAVEKAPHWTDLYYRIVEHYFWKPQEIGRISNPKKPSQKWGHWLGKLQGQETPLNHILDLFFHMAPQPLLDQIASKMLSRTINGLELVHAAPDIVNPNIVQPDIILTNGPELVFIEMKVDSRSSLDQYAKYAIAALELRKAIPEITTVDLVMLSRHADHSKLWRNARKLGLDSIDKVKRTASAGLRGETDIWKEGGVPKYLSMQPDSRERLAEQAETMGLHLADYNALAGVLDAYARDKSTLGPFVGGVLHELRRRELIG